MVETGGVREGVAQYQCRFATSFGALCSLRKPFAYFAVKSLETKQRNPKVARGFYLSHLHFGAIIFSPKANLVRLHPLGFDHVSQSQDEQS